MHKLLYCVTCGVVVGMMLCEPFFEDHREHVTYVTIAPSYSFPREEHIPETSYPTIPPPTRSVVSPGTPSHVPTPDKWLPVSQVGSTPSSNNTSFLSFPLRC